MDQAADLKALRARTDKLHLAEFWSEIRPRAATEPSPNCAAHLWRFEDCAPLLWEAAGIVPVEEAERRAVLFRNPALGGRIATTSTLYAAYSLYNPGEHAPAHRHTINAARIGLFGKGGFTNVDGVQCMIGRGDIVLTPGWSWHDHGNAGAEANIWFDVLDAPLVHTMGTRFFDFEYREGGSNVPYQTPQTTIGAGDMTEAAGTIFYEYARTRALLAEAPRDPFDGATARLANQRTGGPALDTMEFHARLLPAGSATLPVRQTASAVFLVLEGKGHTMIGDTRFDWQENDVFVVPNWTWARHACETDAVLYAISDEPVVRSVGGWRREGRGADGSIAVLA
jgi:gentisate 1,2-dioxygenase